MLPKAIVDELRALFHDANVHRHRWGVGDLLILDNFKTLHARDAFSGPRRLRRLVIGPYADRVYR